MTTLNFQVYLGLRKASDQVGLSVKQVLDITAQAKADGFDLDFAPLAAASDNPVMEPEVRASRRDDAPGWMTPAQSNEEAQRRMDAFVASRPVGNVIDRDYVIRAVLLWHDAATQAAYYSANKGGAPTLQGVMRWVTFYLGSLSSLTGVKNDRGEYKHPNPRFIRRPKIEG